MLSGSLFTGYYNTLARQKLMTGYLNIGKLCNCLPCAHYTIHVSEKSNTSSHFTLFCNCFGGHLMNKHRYHPRLELPYKSDEALSVLLQNFRRKPDTRILFERV